ncbi:hypothetical protein ElyMa_005675000 [Elysia marginata]|uniref:60S ribosomal protein L35 n=1 Tax=Elysia marginata TaxID=1093978 RepID=A0AAV4FEF1_9GAST|nr:hypothetical protein ElyMa_005675000 [Elysia marginata]
MPSNARVPEQVQASCLQLLSTSGTGRTLRKSRVRQQEVGAKIDSLKVLKSKNLLSQLQATQRTMQTPKSASSFLTKKKRKRALRLKFIASVFRRSLKQTQNGMV